MKKNNKITISELMERLFMSQSGIKKIISKLKDEGKITRNGGLKSGYWQVIQNNGEKT